AARCGAGCGSTPRTFGAPATSPVGWSAVPPLQPLCPGNGREPGAARVDDPSMRLVGVRRLEPGAVLARDVHTGRHGRAPLLVRGVTLDERRVAALERAGIHAVYVDDELGSGIEVPQALSEETRIRATAALDTAFKRQFAPE